MLKEHKREVGEQGCLEGAERFEYKLFPPCATHVRVNINVWDVAVKTYVQGLQCI